MGRHTIMSRYNQPSSEILVEGVMNDSSGNVGGTSVVNLAEKRKSPFSSFNPDAKEFVPRQVRSEDVDGTPGSAALPFESHLTGVEMGNTSSSQDPLWIGDAVGRSYAQVAGTGLPVHEIMALYPLQELCPYAMDGECRFGDKCVLMHGLVCDLCQKACLHPLDETQQNLHRQECLQQHMIDMEHSFAIAESADKTCSICLDTVMNKPEVGERRFGILPSCNHCFCISCIRKWRKADDFDSKVIRACPMCRVASDFVCPSRVWVETKEGKEKLIRNYKDALRKKECRYYKHGDGICPFGNKCFYRHTTKAGIPVDVGAPMRLVDSDGNRLTPRTGISLSEYLQERETRWANEISSIADGTSESGSDLGDFVFSLAL